MKLFQRSILLAALFLGACSSAEPAPQAGGGEIEQADEAAPTLDPIEPQETAAEVPTADGPAKNTGETIAATEAEAPPKATEPSPSEEEANTPEPAPTVEPTAVTVEEPAINGPYEKTYFRGSANAPVTLIDYSDFL
jgi:hypothetical protein